MMKIVMKIIEDDRKRFENRLNLLEKDILFYFYRILIVKDIGN
jgi:hypothetical protein